MIQYRAVFTLQWWNKLGRGGGRTGRVGLRKASRRRRNVDQAWLMGARAGGRGGWASTACLFCKPYIALSHLLFCRHAHGLPARPLHKPFPCVPLHEVGSVLEVLPVLQSQAQIPSPPFPTTSPSSAPFCILYFGLDIYRFVFLSLFTFPHLLLLETP